MERIHVVHDGFGRILAVAETAEVAGPGGGLLRHEPHPRPGQHLVQLDLEGDLQDLHALALLRDYELDLTGDPVALRRRRG